MHVSPEIRNELSFWLYNIDSINGKVMSPKSSAVGVVYSDASDSGFGGYLVQCGLDLVSSVWSHDEICRPGLLSERFWQLNLFCFFLVNQLSGLTVK